MGHESTRRGDHRLVRDPRRKVAYVFGLGHDPTHDGLVSSSAHQVFTLLSKGLDMARSYDFELLLVRHGTAHDHAQEGDARRELTAGGRASFARSLQGWRRMDWYWSRALTSPYDRARQTADIAFEALKDEHLAQTGTELSEPEREDEIVPHGDPDLAARRICAIGHTMAAPRPLLAVFCHNPIVSSLASLLVGGDLSAQFSIGRGDVVHLFVPAPSPFDLILDPGADELLPRAVMLGMYPERALGWMRH